MIVICLLVHSQHLFIDEKSVHSKSEEKVSNDGSVNKFFQNVELPTVNVEDVQDILKAEPAVLADIEFIGNLTFSRVGELMAVQGKLLQSALSLLSAALT